MTARLTQSFSTWKLLTTGAVVAMATRRAFDHDLAGVSPIQGDAAIASNHHRDVVPSASL